MKVAHVLEFHLTQRVNDCGDIDVRLRCGLIQNTVAWTSSSSPIKVLT